MTYSDIILKPGKESSLLRFHPWVFSGAIEKTTGTPQDGDLVRVFSSKKKFLGAGHFHHGSISVRILSHSETDIEQAFWDERIAEALAVRLRLGMSLTGGHTNAFRWCHGEGDGVSGLIIDWYNGTAVMQAHSIGMYRALPMIQKAIQNALPEGALKAIYNKSKSTLPNQFALQLEDGYRLGGSSDFRFQENGVHFEADWEHGQKTGFFLDQRDNRALLGKYAVGRSVLNTFCYTGGFSAYALADGASEVHSVDVSAKAMLLTESNVNLNGDFGNKHHCHTADVMDFLKKSENAYDLVVLDPPAFAKAMDKRHNAVQAYKRLNIAGMQKVKPGGLLFTFSCSQLVDKELFYNTIVAAAIEAGRRARVLHHLNQAPCHPVNCFHPEGHYLKGLVLELE